MWSVLIGRKCGLIIEDFSFHPVAVLLVVDPGKLHSEIIRGKSPAFGVNKATAKGFCVFPLFWSCLSQVWKKQDFPGAMNKLSSNFRFGSKLSFLGLR